MRARRRQGRARAEKTERKRRGRKKVTPSFSTFFFSSTRETELTNEKKTITGSRVSFSSLQHLLFLQHCAPLYCFSDARCRLQTPLLFTLVAPETRKRLTKPFVFLPKKTTKSCRRSFFLQKNDAVAKHSPPLFSFSSRSPPSSSFI